jgi:hypothetical protein
LGFAYCDFHHQGGTQMLMARAVARPRALRRTDYTGSVSQQTEVATRVETPKVESTRIEPVKSEATAPAKPEGASELRRSTD